MSKRFDGSQQALDLNSTNRHSLHTSAVCQKVPQLLKLDGNDLPPPIGFDVDTPTTLPPCKFVHHQRPALHQNGYNGADQQSFCAPPPSSSPVPTLTAPQQEMLSTFSLKSDMNLEWSLKCLQDNKWDLNKAAHIFTQLKTARKIPDLLFLK
ncbi:nuclear RNA export factor 1-like [Gouania willdenowi]|uniref:nuclear RNA export factor 1-like n=1 Tax=Gouania willdenowi TaxID=441366 RepID=UPI001055ABF6|nr:nuclear RNA export factor 1-like [Gouania willdenowi]